MMFAAGAGGALAESAGAVAAGEGVPPAAREGDAVAITGGR